ncbi:MAG: hypothetical protein H6Q52_2552 [Deltaproteobacteria bacterium]|nr:hypothetical protein [Deltaproteobacteria bacterium]
MRLQILKNFITYAILIFYICTPMLDGMVCADCIGNAPFRGEITISHMKTAHADVSYSQKGEKHSNTATEQGHKSFCSICANALMGTEISSINPPIVVVQCINPPALPVISELHYSIDKPPQNILV